MEWNRIADMQTVERAIKSLNSKNIGTVYTDTKEAAKAAVLSLIPEGAEVLNETSETLVQTGLKDIIENSGRYRSMKREIFSIGDSEERAAARRRMVAPEYAIGNVNAITEQGELLIASRSGSQLPPYAYSARNVVFVAGTQKIVKSMDAGIRRIAEYVSVLEDERARKAYGIGTSINKMLTIYQEAEAGRITVVLVGEPLGF
jgi:hypothetical protein